MRQLVLVLFIYEFSSFGAPPVQGSAPKKSPEPVKAEKSKDDANFPDKSKDSDAEFRRKLGLMLEKTEKSIKIIREQIIQNQSAPFLADLYLQLGDLLTQKSTVLYYLQMQSEHHTDDNKISATSKYSPVVVAAQEAIGIYEQILKEFPKFDKRDKVLYRLAVSQKSIDEGAAFEKTSERLISEYPNSKETLQARLLLGQHYFDLQSYNDAMKQLELVKESSAPYERNAARYRIGLIQIQNEKYADALKNFELVATDNELKEDQNNSELNLKAKISRTNLKREALIDSVRAYTEVKKENPDPVTYYAQIASTEALFQETIEKLAYRYIFLKSYPQAIKLLRVLSERISDPQKVMNIYQEVLTGIPVVERIDLPVSEMAYVLDKYNDWSTHYNLSDNLRKTTYEFFEKQMRELGTRSHDLAKVATTPEKKAHLFERARQYYLLYLGYFDKGPKSVKIATNLADVYYNQRNFFQSGSYYLRVFSGEFGPASQKVDLIQNAILSLQKPADYAYYEQLRAKGLMVKAVSSYMALDPKKRDDPALNFALAKSYFEQGYYAKAINDLYGIMKRFPTAKETPDAADLILHYYNTRSDYPGLVKWSEKMLALKTPNPTLIAHLQDVRSKAQLRQIDEAVKTTKDYDVTAQGKSYLATALSITDSGLRSAALQQALGHSKQERDVETFIRTAVAMAKVEKDSKKRADIWNSVASELLGITRFYQSLETYQHMVMDASFGPAERKTALENMLKVASMLYDPNKITWLLKQPAAQSISSATRDASLGQLQSMMEEGVSLSEDSQNLVLQNAKDDARLVALYKIQNQLAPSVRHQLVSRVASQCSGQSSSAICKWHKWPLASSKIASFVEEMRTAPPQMGAIDPAATKMAGLLDYTKLYERSGEPQVDILIALGNAQIYQAFSSFLDRAAAANAEVAQILKAKASESAQAAKTSQNECGRILDAAGLKSSPLARLCASRGLASIESTFSGASRSRLQPPGFDPKDSDETQIQRNLFAARDDWKGYFSLGEAYLSHRQWHHAIATSMMARSTFPQSEEEFNAILGCALVNIGLKNEARFVLKKASDLNGHKTTCQTLASQ